MTVVTGKVQLFQLRGRDSLEAAAGDAAGGVRGNGCRFCGVGGGSGSHVILRPSSDSTGTLDRIFRAWGGGWGKGRLGIILARFRTPAATWPNTDS